MPMRNSHLAVITGIWLSLVACSEPAQDKTANDLKAVGHDAATAVKDFAHAPAAQQLGSDIKQGTQEAADRAGEKIESGAKKAGAEIKAGAKDAAAKTEAALNKANADVKK